MGWKPSQLLMTSEAMDLGGETTTASLLNKHNPQVHSKYLPLYPQRSVVVLTLPQGNFSLQQIKTIIENVESWSQAPSDIPTTQPLYLRLTLFMEEGWIDCKKQMNRKFAVRLCLLEVSPM